MKTTVLFISVILVSSCVFPQSDTTRTTSIPSNNYWSIEYTLGESLSLYDNFKNTSGIIRGFNAGIELVKRVDDGFGMVINAHYNRFNYGPGSSFEYVELTTGPRVFAGHGRNEFFIETGLGNYITIKNRYPWYYPFSYGDFYSNGEAGLGVNAGIGKVFRLSEHLGLVGKWKVHTLFPGLRNAIYSGIYIGIVFENDRKKKSNKKDTSAIAQWSLSMLGGISNPDFFHNQNYLWAPAFGFETALQTGNRFEFYGGANYSSFKPYYFPSDMKQGYFDLTFGPRYFIGTGNAKAFLEEGGGVYVYYRNTSGSFINEDPLRLGFACGTGLMIDVLRNFKFVLKSKVNFVFSDRHYFPDFLTLSAGIRTEL